MLKKGVSLIELIAVIIVMGIIAGICIPTTIHVINRQEKKACEASCKNVGQHFLTNMMFNIDPELDAHEVLTLSLNECSCIEKAPGKWKGICPTGLCDVELDDLNQMVINCPTHGHADNVITIDKLYSSLSSMPEFQDYFNERNRNQLDSTGNNYGQPFTTAMEDALDVDLSDYTWRIFKTSDSNIARDGTFQMYLTPVDVTTLSINTSITCTRYCFNEDGSVKSTSIVTATVKEKDVDGEMINYIQP